MDYKRIAVDYLPLPLLLGILSVNTKFQFFFLCFGISSLFSFPFGLGGQCQDLICYLQFCWMDSELPHGDITSLQASKSVGTALLFEHYPL